MVRRISRAVRPCLRQLSQGSSVSTSAWALATRHVTTAPNTRANAAAVVRDILLGGQMPTNLLPTTQPPSARPIDSRKSQLIRTYTSLLRTTPLILFFQHSNLTAVEWAAVRRELKKAVEAVAPPAAQSGSEPINIAPKVQLNVMRTNMMRVSMKIVEFFDPESAAAQSTTPRTEKGPLIHDLSKAAYESLRNLEAPEDSAYAQLEPLLIGPTAALVLPSVSPTHLAAALSVLSPVPGRFPAPKKKKNPGYHDPICQSGLSKLMLVGGRIESKVFDQEGVRWVGGIEGGMDGLRAQLVHVLQGASLGVTNALEGGSRSLWLTLEGRKGQLEEENKPAEGEQKSE